MRKDGGEAPPVSGSGARDKPVNSKYAKTEKQASQGAFGAALAEALKRK
jgi:protein Tex